jgi:hypothetical protein
MIELIVWAVIVLVCIVAVAKIIMLIISRL